MNKFEKNSLCVLGFIAFIALLVFVGNIALKFVNNDTDNSKKEEATILYQDENKDIVYYDNITTVSEDAGLIYHDIHINLDSEDARKVENELNDKMASIKGKYELISESDVSEDDIIMDYDDILEAEILDYSIYDSSKYLTILANSYTYYATLEDSVSNLEYYVFDKYTGKLLNNDDILKNENINNEDVINKIREYLVSKNDLNIDIDGTINNNYQLFYNEYGELMVKILVNMGEVQYNDVISFN